jgi:hypothetical protein
MTSLLDRLFSPPSQFSGLSADGRRRARTDLRELSSYIQRDIGLFDGDEALASRFMRPAPKHGVTPLTAPMRCVHP